MPAGGTLARARGRALRGIGFGAPKEGTLCQRDDLRDLLRRPPPTDGIIVLPTLTAQAALVLDRLGVTAVCTEHGGRLSHGALVARERGLTALIGCAGCRRIPDGSPVKIDPARGRLEVTA